MEKKTKGRVSILALSVVAAFLVGVFGFIPKAFADEGSFVVVNNKAYSVKHNGNGPYIRVNGMREYLDSGQHDRIVLVSGKAYPVIGGSENEHHRHDHENSSEHNDES